MRKFLRAGISARIAIRKEKPMKKTKKTIVAAAFLGMTTSATAFEVWKDYVPSTEVYTVSFVQVKPNRIDDYLAGLKQSWMNGCEAGKKEGVVKDCRIYVSTTPRNRDFNVLLVIEAPNAAASDPDRKRYEAIEASVRASLAKDKEDKLVEGYEQMRSFFGEQDFRRITFK
jgi:hypothetical protein